MTHLLSGLWDNEMVEASQPLQSVDRALTLLALLAERHALRVQETAAELGVGLSTAHRLLTMLRTHGYAVQDRQHVYRPGPAMRALTGAVSHAPDLPRLAHPELEALVAATRETAHLMVLEGRGARFVDGVDGLHALRVAPRLGLVLPAHVTSGGKALLATLSKAELDELYPSDLRLMPGASGPDIAKLRRELATVRRRGYAVNTEESEQGVNAVGACVRDHSGRAVAAVVVAAPTMRVPAHKISILVAPVLATAEAISRRL